MKKICVGMSDEERKEILDGKEIKVPFSSDKIKIINEEEKLIDVAREILESSLNKNTIAVKLYEEFFQKSNLEFEYSKGGMKESISKQYSNYDDFAKMLTCFNDVVKNGIGLEVHENRYDFDRQTDKVFVLVSAFRDQKNIYLVKLEIKTFENLEAINGRNKEIPKLYILITSDHIKKKSFPSLCRSMKNGPYSPENSSKIMIRDLLENVNIKSESLIKYIPDGYLSPEKLEVKRKALEKEKEYILQKQKNRAIKVEQRQQRREERKGEGVEKISLAEKNLRALRDRKGESIEAIKQPPETKQLSLAEKNLMALREKKAREKDKGIER